MSVCPASPAAFCGECALKQLGSRKITAPVSSCRPNQPGSANLLGPHRKGGTVKPRRPGKSQLGNQVEYFPQAQDISGLRGRSA